MFLQKKAAPTNASAAPNLNFHLLIRRVEHQLTFVARVDFDRVAVAGFAAQHAAGERVLHQTPTAQSAGARRTAGRQSKSSCVIMAATIFFISLADSCPS